MNGSARVLIIANAFAAAASFVGAWFVAGRVPGLLAPEIIVLGLVGVAYFHTQSRESPPLGAEARRR